MSPQAYAMWQRILAGLRNSAPAQFAGGVKDLTIGDMKPSDLLTGPAHMARHPIDSISMLGRGAQDASQGAFENMFSAEDPIQAAGYGAAGAIPLLGPVAAMTGEEFGKGNFARGAGMATALLGPGLYGAGKFAVGGAGEIASEMAAMRAAKGAGAARRASADADFGAMRAANPNTEAQLAALDGVSPRTQPAPAQWDALRSPVPRYVPPDQPAGLTPLPPLPGAAAPSPVTAGGTLPTRREALAAGGAVAAAALAPRLLMPAGEAAKAAATVDAPVLGRMAPSALGREGFYRETKNRVGLDMYDQNDVISDLKQVPVSSDSYAWDLIDNSTTRSGDGPHKLFMTRVLGEDGKTYGKTVTKIRTDMGRQHVREALRRAVQVAKGDTALEWDTFGGRRAVGDTPLNTSRIVHSEITPEAALRLNTIEKRAATSEVLGPRGGSPKVSKSIQDITKPDDFNYFKIEDSDGAITKVVAVPRRTPDGFEKAQSYAAKDARKRGIIDKHNFADFNETWGSESRAISYEEAKAISNNKKGSDIGGYHIERPDTVGISPRYTKRVSIRLLKDTMAKQIAENKRAAGRPPSLLARPPVLQDNPALSQSLSRFDFLRGKKR